MNKQLGGLMVAAIMISISGNAVGAESVAKPAIYTATITRDIWGIAHIQGKTDADAVYGMMYAQAEDDFNRIETNYLTNLGRLAEAEGEGALWQDLRQRLFLDPDTLKADYRRIPPRMRALMDAWAAGLNDYLKHHPETKPRVITRFEPWMPLAFSEGSIGGDISRVPLSQLEAFYSQIQKPLTVAERDDVFREPSGSNGFAIAPSHTRDGHALLLINPHTSFFFRAEQQVTSEEGLNAYGASTWGQFFIYQGFNENTGWMHTSSGVDSVDEFAETVVTRPNGQFGYRYGKQVRPIIAKPITLAFKAADGSLKRRTFTTYATHHGPIVRKDEAGKWIAFALMNKPVEALQQSFGRTKTRNYKDFMAVAALQANSSNNTLFASRQGDIAYLHPQFVPERNAQFDYRRPVNGADPRTDWKGLTPLQRLPKALNPAVGWVYNTNDAPWSVAGPGSLKAADFPVYMDSAGANPRGESALRVLNATTKFTPETLMQAAYDPYLPAFARLIPTLVKADAAAPEPKRSDAIKALTTWDYRWSLTSQETTLAVLWGEALWNVAAPKAAVLRMSVWDYMATRSTDAERLAALDDALAKLQNSFGSTKVAWGDFNRFQRIDGAIVQKFDDAVPSTAIPSTSAQWGSLASFGAQTYPGTKKQYGTYGNSFVAVVEFGPKVKAWAISAGGQSGNPASAHFADQVQRYAAGDLRPVYFYPEDVKAHSVCSYRPGSKCQ